jgi:prephenate dehydrogenase
MHPRRLSILGVGLLGGSIGLAVKNRLKDCKIVGYGHRPATLQAALKMGAIDEAYGEPGPAVRGADLVILCTPVGVIRPLLSQIAPELADGAIVTDVGSTKRHIVEAGQSMLPARTHFVGSHPMAGSEKRSIEFAREDLYDRAVCITTPTPKTNAQALAAVEAFWKQLGMRTTRLPPEDHDRLLADVSHLPHALAAALIAMQEDAALDLCGKGFLDVTRIAGGDGSLWRDILLDNRDNVRRSIARLVEHLREFEVLLEAGQSDALEAWLRSAAERRKRALDRREGE